MNTNTPNNNVVTTKRRLPVLSPSSPYRNKRIPFACSIVPLLTVLRYFLTSLLNYLSGGFGSVTLIATFGVVHALSKLVPKYAPTQQKLEDALEDLKLKFPVIIGVGICIFCRLIISNVIIGTPGKY